LIEAVMQKRQHRHGVRKSPNINNETITVSGMPPTYGVVSTLSQIGKLPKRRASGFKESGGRHRNVDGGTSATGSRGIDA
jgi:hypothetical protein